MPDMKCTGEKCPVPELTKGATVCTAHDCKHRTPPTPDEEMLVELLTEDEIRMRKAANRRKRGMTLKRAIRLLEKEYESAKGLDWIHNPTAYALYQVWKMADRRD